MPCRLNKTTWGEFVRHCRESPKERNSFGGGGR